VDLRLDMPVVTTSQAVDGMRRPFLRSFGRTVVGQRHGRAAWTAFHAALMHGSGINIARSQARIAAEARNRRTMLVARWTTGRISRVVDRAVRAAADSA